MFNMMDMVYALHERCNLLNTGLVSGSIYFLYSRDFDKLDGMWYAIIPMQISFLINIFEEIYIL